MDALTPDQWDSIVQSLGEERAVAWAQEKGVAIPGETAVDEETPEEDAGEGYAEEADPEDLGVEAPTTSPLAVEGGSTLESQLMRQHSRIAQLRQQQFEQAKQALMAQRMGPSLSERLAQLSAAFAMPTRTRGFSGVMANIMPVLGQQQGLARKAADERQAALAELQNKYLSGGIEGEKEMMGTTLKVAALKDKLANEGKPRYTLSPITGLPTPVPKKVYHIRNKEDYDRLDVDDFYYVPAGKDKGTITQKGAEGG